jgi:hypothetical protein
MQSCRAFGDKAMDKGLREDIGAHRFATMHRLNGTLGDVFQHRRGINNPFAPVKLIDP